MTPEQFQQMFQQQFAGLLGLGDKKTPEQKMYEAARKTAAQYAAVHPAIKCQPDYREFLKLKFTDDEYKGTVKRRRTLNPASHNEIQNAKRFGINPQHFNFVPDPNGVYPGQTPMTPFLTAAIQGAPTLDPANRYVQIISGVQSKRTLQRGSLNAHLKRYACERNFQGNYSATDFEISVCNLEMSWRVCREQLIGSQFEQWTEAQNIGLGGNGQLPTELQDLMISETLRTSKSEMEMIAWNGDPSATMSLSDEVDLSLCTGFLKRINDSSETIKVAGTTLTPANFFNEWDNQIKPAAFAQSIVLSELFANRKGNLIAFTSYATQDVIRTALRIEANTHLWERGSEQNGEIIVDGVRFVASPAIPNNTIVLTFADASMLFNGGVTGGNLWLVTDQESNFEEITFERDVPHDYYYTLLKFRMGTAIPYPEHLLIYQP